MIHTLSRPRIESSHARAKRKKGAVENPASELLADGKDVVTILVNIVDGIHDLLHEENAQTTDRPLLGTEGNVGILLLCGVEGLSAVRDDEGDNAGNDSGVDVDRSMLSLGIGIEDNVGDSLFQGEVETHGRGGVYVCGLGNGINVSG